MSEGATQSITATRISEARRVFKAMLGRWVVIYGMIIILFFVLIAIAAPLIAPYDPYLQDLQDTLQSPSIKHWLGTDELGRDTLSRLMYGAQISLMVGAVAVAIAGVGGTIMGLIAGYFIGWPNTVIMRITDALMSLPPVVLMLAIAAVLGGGLGSILISVGIVLSPTYCRLVSGQILVVKENDYITAANVIGARDLRVIIRHILPNVFPPLLVLLTINLGTAIMFEATLSFLGIGIVSPTPAWGSMVMNGYRYLLRHPELSFAPGLSIMFLVLGFNMLGDGLRDALDPRLRGAI